MTDESDSIAARLSRRTILRGIGASGVLLGGVGTASAGHNGNGRGPPPGKGPDDDQGQGGGPTHLTGGSGYMPGYPDIEVTPDENPEDGPDARFEIGTFSGDTVEYWTGCAAVEDENVPTQTFKVYPVTWVDGSGPTEIYIYQKKPVQSGVYNLVEAYSCPEEDDLGPEEEPGPYWRVGYEPGAEHEE